MTTRVLRIGAGRSDCGGDLAFSVHEAQGAAGGPTVVLLAGVHGDEVAGVDYARRVFQAVAPKLTAGTLKVVPVANPVAFARRLRAVDEDTGTYDLNRSFGGESTSTAGRLAVALATEVLDSCDVLIDLHHGAWGEAWGMVGVPEGGVTARASEALAEAFGFPLLKRSNGASGSATWYVRERLGKATLSVCIGGSGFAPDLESSWRRWHVEGIGRVLKHLAMLDGPGSCGERVRAFTNAATLVTHEPGMLVLERALLPGTTVTAGERLGSVVDPFDFVQLEELFAPVSGTCYAATREGPIRRGRFVASIAEDLE